MKISDQDCIPEPSYQASFLVQPTAVQFNLDYFDNSIGEMKPKLIQQPIYEEMSTESTQNKLNPFSSLALQNYPPSGSMAQYFLDTDGTLDRRRYSSLMRNNNQQQLLEEKAVQMMQRLELSHVEEEESKSNSNETTQNNSHQNSPPPQLNYSPPQTVTKKVTAEDFEFQGLLGEGSYGRVYLAKKANDLFYAIKVIEKRKVLQLQKQAEVFKERKALIMLDHQCIMKMHWSFDDKKSLYFVLDLAPNGELFTALKKEQKFSLYQTQFIAAELILMLEHMHSRGVAHRDLKPSNILLDDNLHIKVVDFGTAKFFDVEQYFSSETQYISPQLKQSETGSNLNVLRTEGSGETVQLPTLATEITTTPRKRGSLVGSEDYVAPEILAGEPSGPAADLWSLGVLIFLFLSGESPFKGFNVQQTFQNIQEVAYQFNDDEPNFTSEAKDLISQLLVKDPNQRLLNFCDPHNPRVGNYKRLKDHAFFAGVNFSLVLSQDSPFDRKRFERSLLKEKIQSSNLKTSAMILEEDDQLQQVSKRERNHHSVLIPSRTLITGELFDIDDKKREETKFAGSGFMRTEALASIVKKRNRLGLYFKKRIVLTSDHQFYYTGKRGNGRAKQISIHNDRARIERMSGNRFKIIVIQTSNTSKQKNKAPKEKSKVFKCSSNQECNQWVAKLQESLQINSQEPPDFGRNSICITAPTHRHSMMTSLSPVTDKSQSPTRSPNTSKKTSSGSFFGFQMFKSD